MLAMHNGDNYNELATQCDCEVIVPEDGSTVQNYLHIFCFYLKQDVAKVAYAFFTIFLHLLTLMFKVYL